MSEESTSLDRSVALLTVDVEDWFHLVGAGVDYQFRHPPGGPYILCLLTWNDKHNIMKAMRSFRVMPSPEDGQRSETAAAPAKTNGFRIFDKPNAGRTRRLFPESNEPDHCSSGTR